jgi:hypothetical protein
MILFGRAINLSIAVLEKSFAIHIRIVVLVTVDG